MMEWNFEDGDNNGTEEKRRDQRVERI